MAEPSREMQILEHHVVHRRINPAAHLNMRIRPLHRVPAHLKVEAFEDKAAAAILGMSERSVRYHPQLPRVQVAMRCTAARDTAARLAATITDISHYVHAFEQRGAA